MRRLFILLGFFVWAFPALAQDDGAGDNGDLDGTEEVVTEPVPAFGYQDEWDTVTARVDFALGTGRASNSALGELRSQLADWRDRFQGRQTINAARIATVRAQIAALGPVPESGQEDQRIVVRREALNAQLQSLRAPSVLAQEAFTEANGLIAEIDRVIRDRQTERFTQRQQSPLIPTAWGPASEATLAALRATSSEIRAAASNPSRRATALNQLPSTLVYLAIALVLVLRGRIWMERLTGLVSARSSRGRGVWQFVLSLGQILLPFLGLLAMSYAIQSTAMIGRRALPLVEALPMLGLFPILAHWLALQLLPKDASDVNQPLGLEPDDAARAHGRFVILGYVLFVLGMASVFVSANTLNAVPAAVVMFPVGALLAWTLYWLGHSMRHTAVSQEDGGARSFRQSLRAILSRGLMVAAVAGVVFAALGYSNAIELITYPAAMTLYVVGVVLLLQRLSVDVYSMMSASDNAAQDALIPVLIGFILVLVALPILALIWGAQVTDLTELLTRFGEGFALGETRISPTNFLTFVIVFVLGYTVTRLLQGALRTTVLPRTKLDAGGKNAIAAGVGYVGIFLAAIVAITTAGIDLSGLAIVAGALSVGIGFGLQNIVSNFVSGIILLIERPISQGDWIEVGGQMGHVRDISVRSTRIETFDRTDVIVPNADLVSNQVTNWTRGNNVGRVIVSVGVAYGTDTAKVSALLREIAEAHPLVLLNPPPGIIFQRFGDDALEFEIRAILRDVNFVMSVKSEMNHAIAAKFAEEGIEIPFAQRDIWLRNPEVLKGGAAE